MLELNDKVLDKSGRIFIVFGTKTMNFGSGENQYYILKPCFQYDFSPGYQCFIPLKKAEELLRKIMSKEEALSLIDNYNGLDVFVSHNPREKKLFFQQIISSGERLSILKVYKTLLHSRKERIKNNKPFSDYDTRLLKTLKTLIVEELSVSLDISTDEIPQFVSERIGEAIFA